MGLRASWLARPSPPTRFGSWRILLDVGAFRCLSSASSMNDLAEKMPLNRVAFQNVNFWVIFFLLHHFAVNRASKPNPIHVHVLVIRNHYIPTKVEEKSSPQTRVMQTLVMSHMTSIFWSPQLPYCSNSCFTQYVIYLTIHILC